MKEIEKGSMYSVRDDGEVFSCFTGRFLKKSLSKGTGYYVVNVILDGCRRPEYIHRLVAKAYIPNPLNLPEVNHKDANKLNNSVDNLEWCTGEYNLQHSAENKLPFRGESHYSTELTEKEVHEICKHLADGKTAKWIAERSGIPVKRNVVLNIRSKRDWKEIAELYSWKMYPQYAKTSSTSRKA